MKKVWALLFMMLFSGDKFLFAARQYTLETHPGTQPMQRGSLELPYIHNCEEITTLLIIAALLVWAVYLFSTFKIQYKH